MLEDATKEASEQWIREVENERSGLKRFELLIRIQRDLAIGDVAQTFRKVLNREL